MDDVLSADDAPTNQHEPTSGADSAQGPTSGQPGTVGPSSAPAERTLPATHAAGDAREVRAVSGNTDTVFWPVSDRSFLAKLKRVAGDAITRVTILDMEAGHYFMIGYALPLSCLLAVLSDKLGRPATRFDALVAVLRQAFYLNQWCGKGYGRRSTADMSRYRRKDACIECSVSLAKGLHELSWGWGMDASSVNHQLVMYFDLPSGQVSFHVMDARGAPQYSGTWDGVRKSLFPGDAAPPRWYVTGREVGRRQSEAMRGHRHRRRRR